VCGEKIDAGFAARIPSCSDSLPTSISLFQVSRFESGRENRLLFPCQEILEVGDLVPVSLTEEGIFPPAPSRHKTRLTSSLQGTPIALIANAPKKEKNDSRHFGQNSYGY
jgi:hypothetical protein